MWTRLVEVAQLVPGRGFIVEREGGALAVFVVEGTPHVLENRCPHRDGDLGAGEIHGGCVYCPLHAWPFDLQTGVSPRYPSASVRIFPSRIEGGWVEAQLEIAQGPKER